MGITSGLTMYTGNSTESAVASIKQVADVLYDEIATIAQGTRIRRNLLSILLPANIVVLADLSSIHVVFCPVAAGGVPLVKIVDLTKQGLSSSLSGVEAIRLVQMELGYDNCEAISVPRALEGKPREEQREALVDEALGYINAMIASERQRMADQAAMALLVPPSEVAQPSLVTGVKAAIADQPFDQSVFVMMRYRDSEHYQAIESAIVEELRAYGLIGRIAKDKAYSDDLWDNVRIYMHACKYGVAVFEEIDEREFNPNVAMELGYMYAWGRRVLLLKDQRMPAMPTDAVGRIYRPFDTYKIDTSVRTQVKNWAERDLGLSRRD